MLNLGLESISIKEEQPVASLEDVFQAELEFHDAYQTFVDYKNVCEIVVKAKASTESMAFASSLLNVSVENIEVSAEALADKFKDAWQKFVALWKKFSSWVKEAIKNVIRKLSLKRFNQLRGKIGKLKCMSIKTMERIGYLVTNDAMKCGTTIRDIQAALKEDKPADLSQDDPIEWLSAANKFTSQLNNVILHAEISKAEGFGTLDKGHILFYRWMMMFGSKISKDIKKVVLDLMSLLGKVASTAKVAAKVNGEI